MPEGKAVVRSTYEILAMGQSSLLLCAAVTAATLSPLRVFTPPWQGEGVEDGSELAIAIYRQSSLDG
jgi:hypothetical protein